MGTQHGHEPRSDFSTPSFCASSLFRSMTLRNFLLLAIACLVVHVSRATSAASVSEYVLSKRQAVFYPCEFKKEWFIIPYLSFSPLHVACANNCFSLPPSQTQISDRDPCLESSQARDQCLSQYCSTDDVFLAEDAIAQYCEVTSANPCRATLKRRSRSRSM